MWRIGPLLGEQHRRITARRIARDMLQRAYPFPRYNPETWENVAMLAGIQINPTIGAIGNHHASLAYDLRHDQWIISYDYTKSNWQKCYYLVHELAHYYQRVQSPQWLCDEDVVYYYEGPVQDAMHEISRRVETLVLGI